MAFLNQFSFLLLAAGLLLGLVMFLRQRGPAEGSLIALLALSIGLIFAFTFFRPTGGESFSSSSLEKSVSAGQPLLIEFQSPYCIACMAIEPIVKQVELDHAENLGVIRVNVLDHGVESILNRYQFRYTPTFVFLDAQGEELWRMVGTLDPERVKSTMEALP